MAGSKRLPKRRVKPDFSFKQQLIQSGIERLVLEIAIDEGAAKNRVVSVICWIASSRSSGVPLW